MYLHVLYAISEKPLNLENKIILEQNKIFQLIYL